MNDQLLTLLIQKSPRAVQPALAARAAAGRQNATLARSLLAQAAQAALADEQADLDPQDRALLAQLITEPDAAINTRGKRRQFKTPGHMKGYTFGTSDFVKADIQPRAVPAT